MLQNIRDRAQGWFAIVIIALICIPFALWGINEYLNVAKEVVVAEINGDKVKLQEFQRDYQQYRQQLQSMFGGNLDPSLFNEERLKKETLDRMVDTRLLLQMAWKSGMRISNAQVAAAVQSLEAFHRDGKFANDLYEQRLKVTGMNPAAFEEQLRQDLLTEQLRQGISSSTFVTARELEGSARLKGQKRSIAYMVLPVDPVKPTVQVTDEEVKKYYEDHHDLFTTPEQAKIAYLDLSLDNLAKQATVNDEVLHAYYQAHESNYGLPEQRSANHILIAAPKEAGAPEVEKARKKAEEFAKLARQGGSFEEIAKKHSDDSGSKGEGGQTGFFTRGVMEKAFEDTAFSMKPGEISDPVRTDFGFHVIRLIEIKPGQIKPFAEVRGEVEQAYRLEQAEKKFYDQAEQLSNLTFENPDTLQVAADALGLPIQESDYFQRTGTKDSKDLTADTKVLTAAFSPEVLEEGTNSEPLELENSRVVVLRSRDHKPPALRTLEEVRKEVVDAVTLEKAKAVVQERAGKLLERLGGGEDHVALAQQEKLKWETVADADRQSPNVNRAVLREVFKLGRPVQKPLYGSVELGTGDVAVVAVLSVQDAEYKAIAEKNREALKDELMDSHSRFDWQDFMTETRGKANINLSLKELSAADE
jgi:peptidyl-prolyl cis-trans isomerase D